LTPNLNDKDHRGKKEKKKEELVEDGLKGK
jgi:hypothetical protein